MIKVSFQKFQAIFLCFVLAIAILPDRLSAAPQAQKNSPPPVGGNKILSGTTQCSITPGSSYFGNGLPGSLGVPVVSLSGLPLIKVDGLVIIVSGGLPNAKGELIVSDDEAPYTIPTSGASIYAGNPPWHNSEFVLDKNGIALISAANNLLDNPLLCGVTFSLQVALEDPLTPDGYSLSRPLRVTLGSTGMKAPFVAPLISPTLKQVVTVIGQGTQPGNTILIEGGLNLVSTSLTNDRNFSLDVPLILNQQNMLFVSEVGGDGVKSAPTTK